MEFKEYIVIRNKDTRTIESNVLGVNEDGSVTDTNVSFERAMSGYSDIDPTKIKFKDTYIQQKGGNYIG